MTTHDPVTAIIPAYQEEARIGETVRAVGAMPGVTRILVVDDGSTDATAERAQAAGAEVVRLSTNGGKGAAICAGLACCPGEGQDILLLLDADLGASAGEAAKLLAPVIAGEADMTIARFPKATGKAGFGLVKGLARVGTWLFSHRWLAAPISGQRAGCRWALTAEPFADGYGLEVAMNIAAANAGARILEVPVAMTHAASERDLRGFLHRGRQFLHIFSALIAAAYGRTGQSLRMRLHPVRVLLWAAALLGAVAAFGIHGGKFTAGVHLDLLLPVLLGLLLAPLCSALLGVRRRNYRGLLIPALGGLCWCPAMLALWQFRRETFDHSLSWTPGMSSLPQTLPLFVLAWMGLGLVDDLWGNHAHKGFRGHLRALVRGQCTTGALKLLAGPLLALGMAWVTVAPSPLRPVALPVAALLIALSANALNLFDMRPGRAVKVFMLVSIPLVLAMNYLRLQEGAWQFPALALALVLLIAVLYAPFDFAALMMLGDTGANALGAFLGLYCTLLLPLPAQALAVFSLLALHFYAERFSLTELIARVRWLRRLDELGVSSKADTVLAQRHEDTKTQKEEMR